MLTLRYPVETANLSFDSWFPLPHVMSTLPTHIATTTMKASSDSTQQSAKT